MIRKPSKPVAWRLFAVTAGIASTATLALGLGAATPAAAQSTPNVIVDLSVLNAPGGYAPYPPAGGAPQLYGQAPVPYGVQQPYGQPRQLIHRF